MKMEVGLVKMEVEMGLFKNLVVFALGFSDISAWFLVSRIRRFLLEYDSIYINRQEQLVLQNSTPHHHNIQRGR